MTSWNEKTLDPPVRLCCGQAHWDVQCPDGLVMCCICFSRFPVTELWCDSDGVSWDICKGCKLDEDQVRGVDH
jgi:hypothetical protein